MANNSSHPNLSVQVDLADRSYEICIYPNAFSVPSNLTQILLQRLKPIGHAVIVCDANIDGSVGESYASILKEAQIRVDRFQIPSGESSKSIEQLSRLWERFLNCKTDRKSVVFAIGGGVVGDLAGFAAATYARGLRFVQVPTTLLSMVDSSVGGKTGINLTTAKNIVGSFWQPELVLIDLKSLDSLPRREYLSGYAEIVKYGMILDADFFDYLEANIAALLAREASVLSYVVAQSCRCKAKVVQADERETTGLRAVLNYGHTFAHAIEATSGYGAYLHGEAVAIGMAMAGQLAVSMGMIDVSVLERQNTLLKKLHLPIDYSAFNLSELWAAMQNDKKIELGKLGFILPTKIGHVQRVEGISFDQIRTALSAK